MLVKHKHIPVLMVKTLGKKFLVASISQISCMDMFIYRGVEMIVIRNEVVSCSEDEALSIKQ
jgi:hypothetical protein